jgi:cellulose synthase (UDP-forming)
MPPESTLPALALAAVYLLVLPWCKPESTAARTLITVLGVLFGLRLIHWELSVAIPEFAFTLPVLIVYAIVAFQLWIAWESNKYIPTMLQISDRTQEADAHQKWHESLAQPPLIYILIPTYNEPWEVLETAVVGARNQDYPRFRIWILDDGRREWLREAAKRESVGYITRETNRDFKAGNLNDGLATILASNEKPDFIVVLDADFVLVPRFLKRVLALMYDPKTAIVQTPQLFYNLDTLQLALQAGHKIPDDMRQFFSYFLRCKDASDRATCTGTSYIVRTECIELVGGWPTESLSEDTLLSIKLLRLGWKTAYLNEPLSFGLAAEGLLDMLAQRGRWQIANVQITLSAWGPRSRARGLAGWYAHYAEIYSNALRAIWRCMRLCFPMLFGLTGFLVWRASVEELASYLLPLFVQGFTVGWMSRGIVGNTLIEANWLLLTGAILRGTSRAMSDRPNLRFNVTPKGVSRETGVIHWKILGWLGLGAAMTLCAVFVELTKGRSGLFTVFFLVWAGRSLQIMLISMLCCFERPKYRRYERFVADEPAIVQGDDEVSQATLRDISISGAAVRGAGNFPVGSNVAVTIKDVGTVAAKVVRHVDAQTLGLRFVLQRETRQALIRKILCSNDYVPYSIEYGYFAVLKATSRGILLGLLNAYRMIVRDLGCGSIRAARGSA